MMQMKNMLFLSPFVLAVRYKNNVINTKANNTNVTVAHSLAESSLPMLLHNLLSKNSGTGSILSVMSALAIARFCLISSLSGSIFKAFS